MKLKISFNTKAIGHFFLEHSEKVVFGLFILVFAAIMYGAVMRREKFEKSPSDLTGKCAKAQGVMEGERPELLKSLEKNRDYKEDAAKIAASAKKNGISEKPYECDIAWDAPIFALKGQRAQPEFFDVTDLRAVAEFGAFQTIAAAAGGPPAAGPPVRGGRGLPAGGGLARGGNVHGKCWVVLTGLVPVEKQITAYKNAFRNAVAYDPEKDVPTYLGYFIDRAEINSPADVKNPKWTTFNSSSAEKAMKEWTQLQAEVVQDKYVDPKLTFPLGPLVNRSWTKSVAHEPEIPLLADSTSADAGAAAGTPEGEDAGDKSGVDNPFPDREESPPATRPAPGPTRRGMPVENPRGTPRGMSARQNIGVDPLSDKPAKYKLLRFFDFNVEPGKSYVYRARLVLKNPNYGKEAGKLIKPELAQKQYLIIPDTTPPETADTTQEDSLKKRLAAVQSNIIFVPNDTQILAESAKLKGTGDLTGRVYLLKWLKDTGQEVYKDFANIERGQVLNFNDVKPEAVITNPTQSMGNESRSLDNTNFVTDATLLDMDGGKKLTGKDRNLTEPSEMLFMFVRGRSLLLMGHNEMEDMSEIKRVTIKPETPRTPERGERGLRTPPTRGEAEGERRLLEPGGDPRHPTPRTRTPSPQ